MAQVSMDNFNEREWVKKYNKATSEKGISAKEYFYILRLAISRIEHHSGIFEASSVDVLKHLMDGPHDGALMQAVKIVKALYC